MTRSFAICAYGDSPYLKHCLHSLAGQTVSSERLLCTATPSPFLGRLAAQYGFRYCVRDGEPGIGADWNFALYQAPGDFVMLAHQDDVYAKHYAETLYRTAEAYPDFMLFTTDMRTLRDGRIQPRSKAEFVKKLLRVPLRLLLLSACTADKCLSLRFGNPVVCPSCAYRRDALGEAPFSTSRRFVLDWELLWQLAAASGRWVVAEQNLLLYRIHSGTAAAVLTENHVREREERTMFYRMWPEPVTELLMCVYRSAYVGYGA